jgi:FtsZ-binding cell division protein ZapB
MMTLGEFIEEQKKILDAFEKHWKQNHKLQPENYPLKNETGDWDEQLAVFASTNSDFVDSWDDSWEQE